MRKALIIVDMLKDFIEPFGKLYCGQVARNIIPLIKAKIETAKAAGDLIIFLCDAHAKDDKEFEKFPPHAIKDTPGADVIHELAMDKGCFVIFKTRYSGFYNTDLDEVLTHKKITEVEVTGVCTSICVMDTVGDLANRDIPVTIDECAVADFDQSNHATALGRMKNLYGATMVKTQYAPTTTIEGEGP